MSCCRWLLCSVALAAFVSASAFAGAQELTGAEKTVSDELKRCPAQNAERCHAAALQQFETSLRREFPKPGAAYWSKAVATLKRHSRQLDAEIRAAEKQAPGATGNAASAGSTMAACRAAGGSVAECYYWVVVLGGGR